MMEEAVAATLEMESYSTQCVKEKEKKVSFVEEATEHDVCMVRSQQKRHPALRSHRLKIGEIGERG